MRPRRAFDARRGVCVCVCHAGMVEDTQMKASHTKKKKPATSTNRIDESDPDSYRRYKKWRASADYNDRELRNAKKRECMADLRAKQKLDPPIIQAARLAAKEDSARRYRKKNRKLLASKAVIARAESRKACQEARDAATLLAMRQRNALDRALWDLESDEWEQT
ncbi:hypothetical protein B0H12DRAFT_1246256 [Mycena haematopus]|nr:hypothetical protein B0H12DRAFT_1246256 [Mycena haematopus]